MRFELESRAKRYGGSDPAGARRMSDPASLGRSLVAEMIQKSC